MVSMPFISSSGTYRKRQHVNGGHPLKLSMHIQAGHALGFPPVFVYVSYPLQPPSHSLSHFLPLSLSLLAPPPPQHHHSPAGARELIRLAPAHTSLPEVRKVGGKVGVGVRVGGGRAERKGGGRAETSVAARLQIHGEPPPSRLPPTTQPTP